MLKGKIIFYWKIDNKNPEAQLCSIEKKIGQRLKGLQHKGKRPNKCKLELEITNDKTLDLNLAKFVKWLQYAVQPSLEYNNERF